MKEAAIQRAILDYLAATGILAFRMNTGAVKIEKRFMRFGSPGMADILAFPWQKRKSGSDEYYIDPIVWIECKAHSGIQSALQKSFQKQVEEHGHIYVIARSVEDVMKVVL
jgi:hypothetical protein